uniref:Uncharacterized protein n=1 Tax=Anguilla anguilla TaxID=7936 RepID=A0A0E9WAW4_ANGAN
MLEPLNCHRRCHINIQRTTARQHQSSGDDCTSVQEIGTRLQIKLRLHSICQSAESGTAI